MAFTVLFLLGLSVLLWRTFFIRITVTADAFGPRTLPQAIIGSLMVWCLYQTAVLVRRRRSIRLSVSDGESDQAPEPAEAVLGAKWSDDSIEEGTEPGTRVQAFGWLPDPPEGVSNRLFIAVAIFLYVILMDVIGFIASTAIFSFSGLWWLREESKRVMVVVPAILSVGMYILFQTALHVRLP